jgi:hypothetical protein
MKTCTFNQLEYKVVPINATEEMVVAFAESWYRQLRFIDDHEANWYSDLIAAAPDYPADASWVSVDERLPCIGKVVDLCINGIVQNETYELDCGDTSDYALLDYFWSRDDVDEWINVKPGQYWKDRPLPPAPEDI